MPISAVYFPISEFSAQINHHWAPEIFEWWIYWKWSSNHQNWRESFRFIDRIEFGSLLGFGMALKGPEWAEDEATLTGPDTRPQFQLKYISNFIVQSHRFIQLDWFYYFHSALLSFPLHWCFFITLLLYSLSLNRNLWLELVCDRQTGWFVVVTCDATLM